MTDFISQGTLDVGLELPEDALEHQALARAIIHKAVHLQPGAVIAIQGSWGRGKTDVLARVAVAVRSPEEHKLPKDVVCKALWINPWQYGTPDLLTPLVISLLEQIPAEKRSGDKALRKAAESIIRAGFNFGMKTAALTIPGAPLFAVGVDAVDKLIGGLFEAVDKQQGAEPKPDPDPVSTMGKRFKELVEALISTNQMKAGARVLVCIDDLDRCLPDRQVALLEAIRFLISSGAPATFLIALDPTLARQALVTHYKSEAFDPDRYLDKMFDLRVNLPAVGPRVRELIRQHMQRQVLGYGQMVAVRGLVEHFLGRDAAQRLCDVGPLALGIAGLSSPRIVRRIFDKIYLLACHELQSQLGLNDGEEFKMFLLWLGLGERWPHVRHALQEGGPDDLQRRLKFLIGVHRRRVDSGARLDVAAIDRLPRYGDEPDLTEILSKFDPQRAELIGQIDAAMVKAGL